MIYCSKCGIANRDGSQFCNDCGASLAASGTGVSCAECGTFNPMTNLFCKSCGTRLVSVSIPQEGHESEELPPITGMSRPSAIPEKTSAEEPLAESLPSDTPQDEMPAWLTQLQTGLTEEEPIEEPPPETAQPGITEEEAVTEAPVEPPAEAVEADVGVSDWLREPEMRPPAKPEIEADIPEAEEEPRGDSVPDWLQDLRGSLPGLDEGEEEERAEPPTWLQEEAEELPRVPVFTEPVEGMETTVPPSEDVLFEPETLFEAPAVEEAPEEVWPAEEREEPPVEIPPWLEALEPETPAAKGWEEESVEEAAEPPAAEEPFTTPGWLREVALDLPQEEPASPAEAPEDVPSKEEAEPSKLEPIVAEEAAVAAVVPEEVPPEDEVGPTEPLEALGFPAETPEGVPPERDVGLAEDEGPSREALPQWLVSSEARAEESVARGRPAEPGPTEGADGAAAPPTETPSWVAPPQGRPEAAGFQGVEGTAALEGIANVIPAVQTAIESPREVAEEVPVAPPVGAQEAAVFRKIVQEEDLGQAPSLEEEKQRAPVWIRWLLSLLLLAAVGVPIILGPQFSLQPAVPAEVQAIHDQVETLQPGDAVLVGWDFDPSVEGEMGPLAEAIIGHLMQRGARVFVISQSPAGPPLALEMLTRLANSQGKYQYGYHYLHLGYLPGNDMALRALSSAGGLRTIPADYVDGKALFEWPVAQGMEDLDDFRLIAELTADSSNVRRWIEQVRSRHEVPLVAGVSAAILPAVQPYYETDPRQLAGLAGGLPGAAAYESLRRVYLRGQSGLESLTGGVLVLVGIMLAGNVALAFGWGRR